MAPFFLLLWERLAVAWNSSDISTCLLEGSDSAQLHLQLVADLCHDLKICTDGLPDWESLAESWAAASDRDPDAEVASRMETGFAFLVLAAHQDRKIFDSLLLEHKKPIETAFRCSTVLLSSDNSLQTFACTSAGLQLVRLSTKGDSGTRTSAAQLPHSDAQSSRSEEGGRLKAVASDQDSTTSAEKSTEPTSLAVSPKVLLPLMDRLVHHMECSPVLEFRIQALACIECGLESVSEEVRWEALGRLVTTPCPEIAALMIQIVTRNVVRAWDKNDTGSVLMTPAVWDLLKRLLLQAEHQADWLDIAVRAEALSASLNLYRFLLLREMKQGSSRTGVSSKDAIRLVCHRCLDPIRTCAAQALQWEEVAPCSQPVDIMAVQRLLVVLDCVADIVKTSIL
eukprot:evm.model.scf_828EXC.6 EVM.evm.TU.scf_828EXC.6   scf_828EXC:36242-37432(+)